MKPLFIIIFILAFQSGKAQEYWELINKETGKGIEGVYIEVRSEKSKKISTFTTNSYGKVQIPEIQYPATVNFSHLGFINERKELQSSQDGGRVFHLLPSQLDLNEVVVTGQYGERQINESVYKVHAINREKIEAQAAVDLADLLSNNLNIRIEPDKEAGSTGVSMLGLNGKYVKILIDNVPLVNIDGNGNNADLSQINLNNIERVEIVEGPMAVIYGANALAGVINLITKKEVNDRLSINAGIHEETVGKEYGSNEGKHIQTLGLSGKIINKVSFRLDLLRNDFKGYKGDHLKGRGLHGIESQSKRGFDWHPKLQHSGSAILRFNPKNLNMQYRYDFYINRLDRLANFVYENKHEATGIKRPYAFDEQFITRRHIHNYAINGKIGDLFNFSSVIAYSNSEREEDHFKIDLTNDLKHPPFDSSLSLFKNLMVRGDFNQFTSSEKIDFEIGYDINYSQMQKSFVEGGKKSMTDVGLYGSLEYRPFPQLVIRPGVRTSFNNIYDPPIVPSLNVKYEPNKKMDFRASIARGFRSPNLIELYDTIPHAGIEITGNPNLRPEDGYNISAGMNTELRISDQVLIRGSANLFYTKIEDQIIMGQVSQVPLKFLYINVDRFTSKGLSLETSFTTKQLTINAGMSYIGRLNTIYGIDDQAEDFLYYPEVTSGIMYNVPSLGLNFGIFHKYYGKFERYLIQTDDNGNDTWRKGKTEPFNWLDMTVSKKFFDDTFKLDFGVKNILNINDVASSATSGGTHSAASPTVARSYGRSFFLRVNYTLKL